MLLQPESKEVESQPFSSVSTSGISRHFTILMRFRLWRLKRGFAARTSLAKGAGHPGSSFWKVSGSRKSARLFVFTRYTDTPKQIATVASETGSCLMFNTEIHLKDVLFTLLSVRPCWFLFDIAVGIWQKSSIII